MRRRRSLLGGSVMIAAALLVASGCASTPPAQPETSQTPAPAPTSPTPTPETEAPPTPAGDPTCETIIPDQTVTDFEAVGWTARAEPFRVGELELPEGVQCIWGDFSTATDHVQIYGWAPITAKQAADAQKYLKDAGWRVEESAEGVMLTESADTTVATDADGYGLTYLFGDEWVKYADTKQGLLLVVWPLP
ncbi:hypothetical protein NQ152_08600 [Microbacterium sp. zg.B48]|uniref:hypothetical protein n=1 Tax=Microbacterium sp. zg.B48 TaxID=2969408 RepID=UPI00214B5D96|nr:hypothetical protein [Microbacterium sp. zg.B48]MCR2763568.1 hypothetical protein [Microbacterium sp. zg.B48]